MISTLLSADCTAYSMESIHFLADFEYYIDASNAYLAMLFVDCAVITATLAWFMAKVAV